MIDRDQYRQQLSALLGKELECADRLQALLVAETNALVGRDAEAMEKIVADKQGMIETLESLERNRKQLVEYAGFDESPAGVDRCIAWCDDGGQLATQWSTLLQRISACQHQNRVNGAQVETSRRHVQQALSLLRGQAPQTNLYSATGTNAGSGIPGRTLARA